MDVLTFCGNILTALACYFICFYFFYLFKKQIKEKMYFTFYFFPLFIFFFGTIHLFEAIATWYPVPLSEVVVNTLKATVSLGILGLLLSNHKKLVGFFTITIYRKKEFLRQERLRNRVIEIAPVGMASLGLDGKWLSVNQALCKMLGYNEVEFKNTNFQDLTHPDDIDKNLFFVKKMIAGEIEIYQTEKRYLHKDGHYVWGWLNTSFLKNEKGEPIQYVAQIVDISERKKIKLELEESKERLRLVTKFAPIGMASVSLEGKWLVVNNAVCQMLGYSESELLAIDFQSITHPDDLDRDLDLVQKVLSGIIEKYDMEKRYRHKDGNYVWGWLNVSMLRDNKGNPIHFVSQIVNITARKEAETKLRQSEIMFRQTMEQAPTGKSLLNPDLKWVIVNPALCNTLGYTKAELLQKNIIDLILPEDKDIGKELMNKLINREVVCVRTEKRHIHKNGSIIWIALNASIIWDKSEFLYLLIQWENITPLKEKEIEVLKFNEQLEHKVEERTEELKEANKELENFTYVLTHDLRQPLKNMSNLSGLIIKDYADDLDEEGNYMLRLIEKNANKVDNLIIDMLNYTKSSKYNLKKEAVDLNILFYEEFEIGKKSYKQKSISLKMDKLPLVLGDKAALRQVCQNLVSNALKYSSKQEKIDITISYSMQESMTIFSIKDNGIGFDENLSHKIFEVFQRLHKESDYSGTGIGMPITAKIIDKHNGNIWAKSSLGAGATFYFTLPVYI